MNNVAEMVTRLRRSFQDVLVLGDLNMRFGNVPGVHETEDAVESTGHGRTKFLRKWCKRLQMLPIHGRPPHLDPARLAAKWDAEGLRDGSRPPAPAAPSAHRSRCTSAALANRSAFTSEVDYIIAHYDACRVQARNDAVAEEDIDLPSTHRPVAATVTLLPAPEAPPPAPAAAERLPRADYGDVPFWDAVASHIYDALPAIRRLATDRRRGLADAITALEQTHKDAMRAGARVHGVPRAGEYHRRYQGIRMPPHVDALFDRCRELRVAYHAARRRAGDSPALAAEAAAAWRELAAANHAARAAARRVISSRVREALGRLERDRVVNAHRLFTELRSITGETPGSYTHSSGIPGDGVAARFSAAFAALYAEERGPDDIRGISEEGRHEWAPYLPTVAAGVRARYSAMLDYPINRHEVYLAVFPVTKALAPHMPLPGHRGCTLCRRHRQQLDEWDPADPTSPVPDLGSHIHGGKAPGSSGITAEMVRFPRNVEGPVFRQRLRYCTALAEVFNRCLEHGEIPDTSSWTDSVITPILKKSVPGHPVDPENPDDYRGIATGNTLPKVLGLVLLRRLMHWCVAVGAIPPNQAGFMVNQSAEFQVFTALETLRHRKRHGQDTYLLFLDLRKAYDSVPQAALWYILRHMGVPDSLVRLLEVWNAARSCRVRVNGELSEAFDVRKGLPQGDVLSPLLFNLYITVLMRRIRSLEGYVGVTWPGGAPAPTIKDLWYADDMLAMARSREQLQLLLDTIYRWSTDWGIAIGVGAGKTNAMLVAHAAGTPQPVEPLMAGPHPVPWTAEYRYLGYNLRPDLGRGSYLAQILRRMENVSNLYLRRNNAVQRLSVTTQLQLLTTLVQGCANYLLAVVPLTGTELDSLDKPLLSACRQILGAHTSSTAAMIGADARIMRYRAIALQHRLRFEQTLRLLPNRNTPAVHVMHALRTWAAQEQGGRGPPGDRATWTQYTDGLARVALNRTAVPRGPAATRLWQVHSTSARDARPYAMFLNRDGLDQVGGSDMRVGREPAGTSPLHMAAFLLCRGHYDALWNPARGQRLEHLLSPPPPLTRASAYGAGGNGSILALTTRLKTRDSLVTQRFRLGTAALTMWPFDTPGADAEEEDAAQYARELARLQSRRCHLCDAEPVNPWHLVAWCQHEHVRRWRANARTSARHLLTTVCTRVEQAYRRLAPAVPGAITTACAELRAAVEAADWDTMDGAQMLMRLACAAPFSAHDVRPPLPMVQRPRGPPEVDAAGPVPLCTALGRLLDAIALPRHLMRPYANAWAVWSYRTICELAGVYTCASRSAKRFMPCIFCAPAGGAAAAGRPRPGALGGPEDDLHHCAVDHSPPPSPERG